MTNTQKPIDGWRVWYTDDRVYNSNDTDWSSLPDDGVLILCIYYDRWNRTGDVRYRLILSGDDWYFYNPDTGLFGSNTDTLSENENRYPNAIFKRGSWGTAEEFERVRNAAFDSIWD